MTHTVHGILQARILGFPDGSKAKHPPTSAGDEGSTPGSGRSPGGGNGTPLLCSCLEKPMDRDAWWAAVDGVAQSRTRLGLSTQKSCVAGSSPAVAHEKPVCLAQGALKFFLACLLPSLACTLGRRSGVLHPSHQGARRGFF